MDLFSVLYVCDATRTAQCFRVLARDFEEANTLTRAMAIVHGVIPLAGRDGREPKYRTMEARGGHSFETMAGWLADASTAGGGMRYHRGGGAVTGRR